MTTKVVRERRLPQAQRHSLTDLSWDSLGLSRPLVCGLMHQPSDSAQDDRGLLLTSEVVSQSRVPPLYRRQGHGEVNLLGSADK